MVIAVFQPNMDVFYTQKAYFLNITSPFNRNLFLLLNTGTGIYFLIAAVPVAPPPSPRVSYEPLHPPAGGN